ncbi:MAG: DUF4080 domain-containing protein [Magnetococcales bacterium]|nr:DUF4080 domain-containing protein [Magnetococcales bacterium]
MYNHSSAVGIDSPPEQNPVILLAALNARYRHTAIGLRYLRANLKELRHQSLILEFEISQRPLDMVERILDHQPKIVGLSVSIWNVTETTQLLTLLREIAPQITVVLGGPEVSYEQDRQTIISLADYVVSGEGEVVFLDLCRQILAGSPPLEKLIQAPLPDLSQLTLPYDEYTPNDIAHRVIYVEASRGCPYHCEFCLSALDKTVRPFPLQSFLEEMANLLDRGVRQFKFMDRTFNLKMESALAILDFFLGRTEPDLFLHFEVVPDRLPEEIRQRIQQFRTGGLQLEVGIQTFNPTVLSRIGRKQDNQKAKENLNWLLNHSFAHIHADLIIGLPGESLTSIQESFDQLLRINPHDIQVGLLKRLRGTPIIRHTAPFSLRFNPNPPYDLLSSAQLDFPTLQRLRRFARYWDLIGNSGRFARFKNRLIQHPAPFVAFLALSDWLFATTGRTHKIALYRLFELVYRGMIETMAIEAEEAKAIVEADFRASGRGEPPPFLG